MSYKKAHDILPHDLILKLQEYVDGEYIYIPRKECNKVSWGEKTKSKDILKERNLSIYKKYQEGTPIKVLSEMYFLSPKWIQKIIAKSRCEY